jgi:3-phosphoshikimate 1-carboxyvinyltransferase
VRPLTGVCTVPGDKSISHRAAILGALADGSSTITSFSPAGDCASTLRALSTLGVGIEGRRRRGDAIVVHGPFDRSPREMGRVDCGRAGTAMRLLAGLIASHAGVGARLTGDPQLLSRPMLRVAEPLRRMGARVGLAAGDCPPIHVTGADLQGIDYAMPVASAQVKSAILLAGVRADGATTVREPAPSRDHTERMIAAMGARIEASDNAVRVERSTLRPIDISVPGDPSSAAFLWAAAAMVPGSDVTVEGVGLNPTRVAFLDLLRAMGAVVEIERTGEEAGEPVGRARVRYAGLSATALEPASVPALIDELPLVGLLATQAEGVTEVRGAEELRVKESDRIAGLVEGLDLLGADAEALPDGFVVRGPTALRGGSVEGRRDHRLAMTFAAAGLVASEPVHVEGLAFAGDSFPGFADTLRALAHGGTT